VEVDFDDLDNDYDIFLPFLSGANRGLLDALADVPTSGTVLDLACGVGEPALTLAGRRPGLRVIGIDNSPAQLAAARARAGQHPAGGAVRFEAMSMDALTLGSGSVDAVMSRMGALMMADPLRTAEEIARVLAPGGRAAIAVWGRLDQHPALSLGLRTLRAVGGRVPDLSGLDALAADGVRVGLLRKAGLHTVESGPVSWHFRRPGFDSWWSFVRAIPGPMQDAFRALDGGTLGQARTAMAELAREYRRTDGSYEFPVTGQLITGCR
jgi:SAM-dependent methyltransferase